MVVHNGIYPWTHLSPASNQKFSVNFGAERLKQPFNVCMKLVNNGTVPIDDRDVESPVFVPITGARIVGAGLESTKPDGVNAQVVAEPNGVRLRIGLLNPGDSVHFDVLTDGVPRVSQKPQGRIRGVRAITFHDRHLPLYPEPQSPLVWLFWNVVRTGAVLFAAWGLWSPVRLLRRASRATEAERVIRGRRFPRAGWIAMASAMSLSLLAGGLGILYASYRSDIRALGAVAMTDIHEGS